MPHQTAKNPKNRPKKRPENSGFGVAR